MVLSGSVFPVEFAMCTRRLPGLCGKKRAAAGDAFGCSLHLAGTPWEAKTTRGLAGLEPVTTELSFQDRLHAPSCLGQNTACANKKLFAYIAIECEASRRND